MGSFMFWPRITDITFKGVLLSHTVMTDMFHTRRGIRRRAHRCAVRTSLPGVVVLLLRGLLVGRCRVDRRRDGQLVEQVSVQLVRLGQRDLQQEALPHQLLQLRAQT